MSKRHGATFEVWRNLRGSALKEIPTMFLVNVTILSNSRPVECSTYRSTICRGRGGRLPLCVRRVLGTSCDLYRESIGLLGATINLHTGVVARGMASWTQQAWPLRCSFSFDPFHRFEQWWRPKEVTWSPMSRLQV